MRGLLSSTHSSSDVKIPGTKGDEDLGDPRKMQNQQAYCTGHPQSNRSKVVAIDILMDGGGSYLYLLAAVFC